MKSDIALEELRFEVGKQVAKAAELPGSDINLTPLVAQARAYLRMKEEEAEVAAARKARDEAVEELFGAILRMAEKQLQSGDAVEVA